MHTKLILFLAVYIFAANSVIAAERPWVAVPQFRNSTGKTLGISTSDMAKWMAKELKKNQEIEAFDPDLIKTFTKDTKWRVDTGFEEDVTARLKQMKTAYVLYGNIHKYRVENFILNDFWRTDEPQVPQVILEFWFRMMDLNGNNIDQEFFMNGDSIADPTLGIGGPPYEESDSRLDVSFQEASKQAMRKAAKRLADQFQ